MNHQYPPLPNSNHHLVRHRSQITPQINREQSTRLTFDQGLNTPSYFNGSTFPLFASSDFQRRVLKSQKSFSGTIQRIDHIKHKRNTCPTLFLQGQVANRSNLTSSCFSPINRKITFTYRSPTNKSIPPSQNFVSLPQLGIQKLLTTNVFQFSKKEQKKLRNKLCTLEFVFNYIPKQKLKSDPFFVQSMVSPIEQRESFLSKIDEKQSNLINESKLASTIATKSFNQNRKSDFPQQNFKSTESSKISYFGSNQKPNLVDQIPKAKLLGETVILTHNDYSFGGIINKDNIFEHQDTEKDIKREIAYQCELRQWRNPVRCLIDTKQSQNLKKSIHEGPQIRLQRPKFEMLDGFGRQIKESTMSIHQ